VGSSTVFPFSFVTHAGGVLHVWFYFYAAIVSRLSFFPSSDSAGYGLPILAFFSFPGGL